MSTEEKVIEYKEVGSTPLPVTINSPSNLKAEDDFDKKVPKEKMVKFYGNGKNRTCHQYFPNEHRTATAVASGSGVKFFTTFQFNIKGNNTRYVKCECHELLPEVKKKYTLFDKKEPYK